MKSSIKLTMLVACLLGLAACKGGDETENVGTDGGAGADMATNGNDGSTVSGDGGVRDDGGGLVPDMSVAVDLGPDDSTPGVLSIEEFAGALAQLICDRTECIAAAGNTGLLISLVVVGDSTGEACVERASRFLLGGEGPVGGDGVTSGRLTYDADAAQACIDSLTDATGCDGIFADDSCLNTLTSGTVAEGEECVRDSSNNECADGLVCARPAGATDGCAEHCTPRVALGAECHNSDECGFEDSDTLNYNCNYDGDLEMMVCMKNVTVNDAEVGDACENTTTEDFVNTYHLCVAGAYCDTSGDTSVCVAITTLGGAGDECSGEGTCEAGLACIENTCLPILIQTEVGDACGFSEAGIGICDSATGVVCVIEGGGGFSGTCMTTGDGTEGAVCGGSFATAFGATVCGDGLVCSVAKEDFPGIGGTCIVPLVEGTVCDSSAQCVSGNCQWDSGSGDQVCLPAICTT